MADASLQSGSVATKVSTPISLAQQIAICQTVAQIVRAKLPLESQLSNFAKLQNGPLATVAKSVEQKLLQGSTLVDALVLDDSVASRSLAACIEVGQSANSLDSTLQSWTAMQLANKRASTRLLSSMIYPTILILVLFISIGMTVWNLVPEIYETYRLFDRTLPRWLDWLVWTRSHMSLLVTAMAVATILPVIIWFIRRIGVGKNGLPKVAARKLRLQALATDLARLQLSASRPLTELLPRTLAGLGIATNQTSDAFQRLQQQLSLSPLLEETSYILGSLYAGLIDRLQAIDLLAKTGQQLNRQADELSLRETRRLPALIAVVVCIVIVVSYATLVYLPWLSLLQQIAESSGIS